MVFFVAVVVVVVVVVVKRLFFVTSTPDASNRWASSILGLDGSHPRSLPHLMMNGGRAPPLRCCTFAEKSPSCPFVRHVLYLLSVSEQDH